MAAGVHNLLAIKSNRNSNKELINGILFHIWLSVPYLVLFTKLAVKDKTRMICGAEIGVEDKEKTMEERERESRQKNQKGLNEVLVKKQKRKIKDV